MNMNWIKLGACLASLTLMGNAIADENNQITGPQGKQTTQRTTHTMERSKHALRDTEITAKVKEKFIEEKLFDKKNIPAMRVHVKTINGVVYLRGKITSKEQEENAINIAKSVNGVKEVKSSLILKAAKHK